MTTGTLEHLCSFDMTAGTLEHLCSFGHARHSGRCLASEREVMDDLLLDVDSTMQVDMKVSIYTLLCYPPILLAAPRGVLRMHDTFS